MTRAVVLLLVVGAVTGTSSATLAFGRPGLISGLLAVSLACFLVAGVRLFSDVDTEPQRRDLS